MSKISSRALQLVLFIALITLITSCAEVHNSSTGSVVFYMESSDERTIYPENDSLWTPSGSATYDSYLVKLYHKGEDDPFLSFSDYESGNKLTLPIGSYSVEFSALLEGEVVAHSETAFTIKRNSQISIRLSLNIEASGYGKFLVAFKNFSGISNIKLESLYSGEEISGLVYSNPICSRDELPVGSYVFSFDYSGNDGRIRHFSELVFIESDKVSYKMLSMSSTGNQKDVITIYDESQSDKLFNFFIDITDEDGNKLKIDDHYQCALGDASSVTIKVKDDYGNMDWWRFSIEIVSVSDEADISFKQIENGTKSYVEFKHMAHPSDEATVRIKITYNLNGVKSETYITLVSGPKTAVIKDIRTGYNSFFAIEENGRVWAWGDNSYGQLGLGSVKSVAQPTRLDDLAFLAVTDIAPGEKHSILTYQGSYSVYLMGTGDNSCHELSQTGDSSSAIFKEQDKYSFPSAAIIRAGSDLSVAFNYYGFSIGWGSNLYHEISDSSDEYFSSTTSVSNLYSVKDLAFGEHFGVALKEDGTLYSGGLADSGRLGRSSSGNSSGFSLISSLSGISKIAVGKASVIAIAADGRVYGWGDNSSGQLLTKSAATISEPTEITSLLPCKIDSVSLSSTYAVALGRDGVLYTWGEGRDSYSAIDGLPTSVVDIRSGYGDTLILLADGSVWTFNGQSRKLNKLTFK